MRGRVMRPAGRYLTALVGTLVLSYGMDPFAGDQTLVVPVTQERIIKASASASDASSGSSEFEDDQAPDFGPFDSVVGAVGSANTAGANSASTQTSEITTNAIQASGGAGHGIYISAQIRWRYALHASSHALQISKQYGGIPRHVGGFFR